jgi:hypothetical protein
MKTTLLVRARRHFNSDVLTREQNRNLQRKWVRAIRELGQNWIMLRKLEKSNGQS